MVVLMDAVLHTKFQGYQSIGSGKEDIKRGSTKYHRLPQTTTDYHRLPQTTPQTTTDHHRPHKNDCKLIEYKKKKKEVLTLNKRA